MAKGNLGLLQRMKSLPSGSGSGLANLQGCGAGRSRYGKPFGVDNENKTKRDIDAEWASVTTVQADVPLFLW